MQGLAVYHCRRGGAGRRGAGEGPGTLVSSRRWGCTLGGRQQMQPAFPTPAQPQSRSCIMLSAAGTPPFRPCRAGLGGASLSDHGSVGRPAGCQAPLTRLAAAAKGEGLAGAVQVVHDLQGHSMAQRGAAR